jgi:NADPH-dependent 7-cyano-7-deazaguanine reductase QueF
MSAIRTVADTSDVTVTVAGSLDHQCPHVDEADHGTIAISWRVNGQTYELHSLADYLRRFKDSRISHEQITDLIRHDLSTVDGIDLLSVETNWTTAGMEVQCSTSPTLVGRP